ncbi:MAG: DUF2971 domain-containing protein [Desulfobulbaceae bacterium]|nr:DUF2971 domain-containing protein [Desulfobulbaceae bacterium]
MQSRFNDNHRNQLLQVFSPLFSDLGNPEDCPKLAHYTSIRTLESILRTNEIWFSNPLFMNDFEELRFGLQEGVGLFSENEQIRIACGSEERFNKLFSIFRYLADMKEHDLDIYVFCLSEHDTANNDGLLSMWRGYGENGSGVALVIDANQFGNIQASPLFISRVQYFPSEVRKQQLKDKLVQFASLLGTLELADNLLWLAADIVFSRIKLFALTTKHHGFHEEKEWRFIYLKERDINIKLWPAFGYETGKRGIEPKLKLKLKPIDGVTSDAFSLDKMLYQVILGPGNTNHAMSTVQRMFELLGQQELKHKVTVSGIPYRAT